MERTTDKVLFLWLIITSLLGSLIGVPYTIAVLMEPAAGGPIDPRMVWLSAMGEVLFFLIPASAVGVWLGKRVGLGPRLWRALVAKASVKWRTLRAHLLSGMIIGFVIGIMGSAQNALPRGSLGAGLDNPSTFEYFLRCLSAAITEEILFRLGLITLFVWILQIVARKPILHIPSLWIGNFLAALLFAGAHLPHMVAFGSAGSSLVVMIVIFSTLSGLIMGWLYIRYGLISAMMGHFVGDVIVYVLPRLLAMG